MEENNNKKVPKLKENYMEIFKNGIMEKKSIITEKEKEIGRLRRKIKREQGKLGNIEDKKSKRFKSKKGYIREISDNLKEKTEQLEKLKEETKNTIAIMRVALQRNIDDLTRKALETQNEKNILEAEVSILETEKSKYEKELNQIDTDSRIPEDERDTFIENANKKIEELKEKIDLKKSKISHILVELPEYINQISEMKDNLQYLDYDKIEEYEVKETDKDEKDEEEKAEKDETAEISRKDEEAERESEEENKKNEKDEKDEKEEESEEKLAQEKAARKEAEAKLEEEKAARKEAEAKLEEEKAKRQKLEQEKADKARAEEARKKAEEEAKRRETNKPYKEDEELPKEQTQEMRPEEDSRPMLYISEKDGVIAYYINELGDMINKATTKEAFKEKKEKYNRLNIKGICKEVAGKRIASAVLYAKINPSIIKALENEPETIYNYIKSIHNNEPLPFKLIHNVAGKSMIQKLAAMRYTRAEKASGAVIQTSNMLGEGRDNSQRQSDYSLLELLDNAQISESQKTAIKDYAIINGEDEAKKAYADTLSDARRGLQIQKFKEASRNLPGKDENAGKTPKGGATIETLYSKGLFSEKRENKPNDKKRRKGRNADFVDRVENSEGNLEKEARKSADKKEEELERVDGEIVSPGYQGPGIGE